MLLDGNKKPIGTKVRDVWRVYREAVEASIQRLMEKARPSDEEGKKEVFYFVPPVCDIR